MITNGFEKSRSNSFSNSSLGITGVLTSTSIDGQPTTKILAGSSPFLLIYP